MHTYIKRDPSSNFGFLKEDFSYPGAELEVFSHAKKWKAYWSSRIRKYIGQSVLEVGAGIGSNTRLLYRNGVDRWVCLEPDAKLTEQLLSNLTRSQIHPQCEVINGRIKDIPVDNKFDTILYLDVLEHIEDDKREIEFALDLLVTGGKIIILSPAHSWLYSEFDRAIGHYRRYNARSLRTLPYDKLELLCMEYLDSVGLIVSLANCYFLYRRTPSIKQIKIWDSLLIPCSKFLDLFFHYRIGKSIMGIWRRT